MNQKQPCFIHVVSGHLNPRRRAGCLWVCLIAMLLSGHAQAEGDQPQTRPNVVLICVDDLKPLMGCYGNAIAQTPNIDRLAQQGVLFQSAYCNQAVCSPSRNALLVGRRPQTLGIYDLATNFRRSAPDAITLPQNFQKHGYHTQALGKIFHVGHGNDEDAASWSEPHWRPKAAQYQLAESQSDKRQSNNGPRGTATESADVADEIYGDGQIAAEAISRIQQATEKLDEPFFIAVGFLKPHLPFVAPKKYWDLYDPATLPMPEVNASPKNAPSYAPQFGGELRQYSDMPQQGAVSSEDTRRLIHGYYAATSYADAVRTGWSRNSERSGWQKLRRSFEGTGHEDSREHYSCLSARQSAGTCHSDRTLSDGRMEGARCIDRDRRA
jgi:iduronate 2-sulfatase